MGHLVLFGFMLGLTLASPTIRPQEPERDQKIMNLTMDPGYMETYENNYTKHSKVKAGQEKYQPQHAEKVRIDNRRESSTNDITDIQDKTIETMFNKTKGVAAEIISANLKSLKHFHKRSAAFSSDQYLSEPNDSTTFPYPGDSSQDTSENHDSASLNDPNNTGSSECSNAAGSSESSNPGSKKSDILSSSEEFTYSYDSQETTHAGSDEINRSSVLNGIPIQSDSSEPDMQYSIFTTPDNVSENSNESRDTSKKADAGLSSESQSVSRSSESNDQNDSSKSSSSSDSSTSSESSEPMTATTTDKLI